MLPSPYNIPGIGTPLHQPEEDQQILPNALQQQQQQNQLQQQQHAHSALGSSPLVGFGASLMGTPQRLHTYAPTAAYSTPQQMMQPQTPVILFVFFPPIFEVKLACRIRIPLQGRGISQIKPNLWAVLNHMGSLWMQVSMPP